MACGAPCSVFGINCTFPVVLFVIQEPYQVVIQQAGVSQASELRGQLSLLMG